MSTKINSLQALMYLLKGYIGTGILAMPKAFSYSGILIGFVGTPLIGIISNICIHQAIEVNDHLCQKMNKPEPMEYEELTEKAFSEGPEPLKRFSNLFGFIAILFLFLTQMGFCCAYQLFIAKNLRQFFMNLEVGNASSMSVQDFLFCILPFMILISFIDNIKHISIASTFANILVLVSFAIIIYNLVTNVNKGSIKDRKLVANKIPQFFSITMFTYEGIPVSMSLYRSMKCRQNFAKTFGVLNIAIVAVITLYTAVGFLGYLKYGDEVAASITLSLPNQPLYNSVQLMYAIAITITFSVQFYVAIHLIWPLINKRLEVFNLRGVTIQAFNYIFRTLLVVSTFSLVILIPKLELILSLSGAVSCSIIAVLIPPIIHTITFWEIRTRLASRIWLASKNVFLFVFGILGFSVGTYFSIEDIITSLTSE